MALPALQKTWQGGTTLGGIDLVNQVVNGEKNVLFAIKAAFTTFNANPWTVIASCDSSSFSMAGTDYWVGAGNLVYRNNSNDPHSWIVLQQANINAKFQICISLDDTLAADANRSNVTVTFSPVAGFGVANGGTDGSLIQKPTATDEVGLDGVDWMNAVGAVNMVLSVLESSDGQCTRLVAAVQSTGVPVSTWGFEVPKSPNAGWANPAIGWVNGSSACFGRGDWQEAEPIRARVLDYNSNPLNVALRIDGPMYTTIEAPQEIENSGVKFWGGGLHHNGADAESPWGTLYDWYWVSRNVSGFHAADLDSFPLAGDRTFVCVGAMVWGWLDDSATDLSYT